MIMSGFLGAFKEYIMVKNSSFMESFIAVYIERKCIETQ